MDARGPPGAATRLGPRPSLAELLEAIRRGGREAYRRLLEVLRELKSIEAGSATYKRALAELARAQGSCSATSASMWMRASIRRR
ncbi:MAG: hypothetical protein ACLP0J_03315 [Solirubrobacteraceae bacterium]